MLTDERYGLILTPIRAGVEALAAEPMTINGVTVPELATLVGVDYAGSTWTCRSTGKVLTLSAGTLAPVAQNALHMGDAEVAYQGSGNKSHIAPDNDWCAFGTKDLIVELAIRYGLGGGDGLINKGLATGPGWQIYCNVNWLVLSMDDGPDVATCTTGWAAITAGSNIHAIVAVNRDEASANGSGWWANGVFMAGSGVDFSAVGDVDHASAARLGGNMTGVAGNNAIHLLRVWAAADVIPAGAAGITELSAVAKKRAAIWAGAYAAHSHGAQTPTVL